MAEDSKDTLKTSEDDGATDDAWGEALAEQRQATQANDQKSDPQDTPVFQPAEFQDLETDSADRINGNANLDMILDIPVTISLEIGRTKISIRNLMQLNQGSVVELDRLAGEPLDVLVNGTLIAHGEVVMVNEKFGIRLTDVISAAERVQNLK
jgi:flagellar motor switch protein FliN/FliY